MQLVRVVQAKPGMVVGRAVMDSTGRVLLQEGVVLTDAYIKALHMKGYVRLYIKDPEDMVDVGIEEDVSPAVRAKAFQALQSSYESIDKEITLVKTRSAANIEDAINSDSIKVLMSPQGPLSQIHDVISQILEDVLNRTTLAGLTSIKSADSHVYDHSIDVCAVAIMIGRVIGLDASRIRQLATGALLHDIGAVFLEPNLESRRRIILHTKLGYELLRKAENADIMAPHVAYEHHEHQDGSGLPRGLRGSNTIQRDRAVTGPVPTLIGEITAVANLYDNLLTGTERYDPRPPDEVIRTLRRVAGKILNRSVVLAFLRVVPIYPQGAEVMIRTGEYRGYTALVLRVNPAVLDKPVLVTTRNDRNERVEPVEIDLNKTEGVEIRCKESL